MKTDFRRVFGPLCFTSVIIFLVWLLAYQRFLLVEARLISMCLTRFAFSAESWLRRGDSERATEMMRKAQDLSVDYILYRKIMFLDVSDILIGYCKIQDDRLTSEVSRELDDYSNEVIEKCFGEKLTYYSIVDHWLLPEMFGYFVPVDQDTKGTVTFKSINPSKHGPVVKDESKTPNP